MIIPVLFRRSIHPGNPLVGPRAFLRCFRRSPPLRYLLRSQLVDLLQYRLVPRLALLHLAHQSYRLVSQPEPQVDSRIVSRLGFHLAGRRHALAYHLVVSPLYRQRNFPVLFPLEVQQANRLDSLHVSHLENLPDPHRVHHLLRRQKDPVDNRPRNLAIDHLRALRPCQVGNLRAYQQGYHPSPRHCNLSVSQVSFQVHNLLVNHPRNQLRTQLPCLVTVPVANRPVSPH